MKVLETRKEPVKVLDCDSVKKEWSRSILRHHLGLRIGDVGEEEGEVGEVCVCYLWSPGEF